MMSTFIIRKTVAIVVLFFLLMSCSEDTDDNIATVENTKVFPKDLSVKATVIKSNYNNPYGDGSGLVRFNLSGVNVNSYTLRFGDDIETTTMVTEVLHIYNEAGVNNYVVEVVAHRENESYISSFVRINVLVRKNSPALTESN